MDSHPPQISYANSNVLNLISNKALIPCSILLFPNPAVGIVL